MTIGRSTSAPVSPMHRVAIEELWKLFAESKDDAIRNELMLRYQPLVLYHSKRLASRLPAEVDLEDLISEGNFGLMDALDAFDPSRNISFKTFCATRIRGAILDHLRSLDWWPRLVRARVRQYAEAYQTLEKQLGRPPADDEMRARLGVSRGKFDRIRKDAAATGMFRFATWTNEHEANKPQAEVDGIEDERRLSPYAIMQLKDLDHTMADRLSKAEQCIVRLYYLEEMTLKQVGQTLGLTESRVCQMLTSIKPRLKELLEDCA